jgi:hypothetical protein
VAAALQPVCHGQLPGLNLTGESSFHDGARCSQTKIHTDITSAHLLWEFMLDEKIRCFRVHHPSARHKSARIGRAGALELLARAVAS